MKIRGASPSVCWQWVRWVFGSGGATECSHGWSKSGEAGAAQPVENENILHLELPRRGRGNGSDRVPLPLRGSSERCEGSLPRVPLASLARGYSPVPLRGTKSERFFSDFGPGVAGLRPLPRAEHSQAFSLSRMKWSSNSVVVDHNEVCDLLNTRSRSLGGCVSFGEFS